MNDETIGENKVTPLMICMSGAGFYIGRKTPYGAPFSRVSTEYYRTHEEAKQALINVEWTPRDDRSIKISLDYDLIKQFREEVNRHEFYIGILKNVSGENRWNLVCSCMDWISVAAGGLPQLIIHGSDRFTTSLNLMQHFASIDILTEAIIQLYRVIGEDDDYPLKEDKSVFEQEESTDDIYFKHLRAVFGIHPVNLKSMNGKREKNTRRYYASWTNSTFDTDRFFSVALYSNDPYETDKILGLDLWQINKFAMKRYNLLADLINKVKKITSRHMESYSNVPICIMGEPRDQLKVLKAENSKRFGIHDGYSREIDLIDKLIEIHDRGIGQLDQRIACHYRGYLISLISEIKTKLEELEYNDESIGDYYLYIPRPDYIVTKSEIAKETDDENLKEYIHKCENNIEILFIRYALIYDRF